MRAKILLILVAMTWVANASLRADDLADARKAFDLYVEYSHTADKRSLDLFAPDVSVTNVRIYNGVEQDIVIPPKRFFQILDEGIAAGDGDKNTYENIRCVAQDGLVKLTCTSVEEGTGERDPMVLIYGKDAAGKLQIKAMKMTYPPLKS